MDPISLGVGAYALGSTLYSIYANRRQEEREDNAVQRRARDLMRAGMSPTLAAGQPALASANMANGLDKNPFMEYLNSVQAKANIAQTNAGTDLAKFQAQTEEYKKTQMMAGVREIEQRIANMQSEKNGLDLRNSWINRDMASQLRLRDSEFARTNAETLRIGQNTELLKAQTAYEQTAMDKLLTEIDIAKIQRDLNNFNLTTSGLRLYNDTYQVNKGLLGRVFGDVRNLFTGFDIRHAINNVDTSWYWDKK